MISWYRDNHKSDSSHWLTNQSVKYATAWSIWNNNSSTQSLTKTVLFVRAMSGPQAAWLLKAVTCIDLTTLAGDDTPSNVHRLCLKAIQPVRQDLLKKMDMHDKGLVLLSLPQTPGYSNVSAWNSLLQRSSLQILSCWAPYKRPLYPLALLIRINFSWTPLHKNLIKNSLLHFFP